MVTFVQDGKTVRTHSSFYRGEVVNYHPRDMSFEREDFIDQYLMHGLIPAVKMISTETPVIAFGSCFAGNISKYLHARKYNILTKKENKAPVTSMGDGIVHTFAIRQQFEWAWENKIPSVQLWHGFEAEEFGYSEEARQDTKRIFDEAAVFIITLGLSEIWYDEPTGEVFWRAVPADKIDTTRHKFRVSTHAENLENLKQIRSLIRKYRPDATVIFTISPIPLTATFRDTPCIVANAASKAILRAALDEFLRVSNDPNIFYFPSYEMVMTTFSHQWKSDRKHVYLHVLDFNMKVFEHYFCTPGATREDLESAFREALKLDEVIAQFGHSAMSTGEDMALEENRAKRKAALNAERIARHQEQLAQQESRFKHKAKFKADRITERKNQKAEQKLALRKAADMELEEIEAKRKAALDAERIARKNEQLAEQESRLKHKITFKANRIAERKNLQEEQKLALRKVAEMALEESRAKRKAELDAERIARHNELLAQQENRFKNKVEAKANRIGERKNQKAEQKLARREAANSTLNENVPASKEAPAPVEVKSTSEV